ncbi:21916_t:CDS:1, partial [Gigaspora rosea]
FTGIVVGSLLASQPHKIMFVRNMSLSIMHTYAWMLHNALQCNMPPRY